MISESHAEQKWQRPAAGHLRAAHPDRRPDVGDISEEILEDEVEPQKRRGKGVYPDDFERDIDHAFIRREQADELP